MTKQFLASTAVLIAVAAMLLVVVARVGRPDRDLDVLRGPLAEQQVVLAAGVGHDVLVHLVATYPNAAADDDAAERDHGHLRGAAADVDDEGP